ncbi:hypothetical protein Mgra_00009831 [Meloidogyne graminicola]|uniref:Uncharacterized protein n=1 Tax=Meloidogyne graminicola TaxID=189291 RepID=A0A8S9Z8E1_9BILA|nr:hypothetical protein Mgra_00009831 [Meloidogyne graminicola]
MPKESQIYYSKCRINKDCGYIEKYDYYPKQWLPLKIIYMGRFKWMIFLLEKVMYKHSKIVKN